LLHKSPSPVVSVIGERASALRAAARDCVVREYGVMDGANQTLDPLAEHLAGR
jgi:hypothetical protein